MLNLCKTKVRAPKPKIKKPPKKPANVYIAGPLYSITKGEKLVTGVIEELTADALTLETALTKLSIFEETKEDHH